MAAENTVRNVLLGGWITARGNIIAEGQNLLMGTVLSEVKTAGDPVAHEENTGDGTVGDITLSAKAKVGNYKLVCNKATGGGEFNVISPAGYSCGVAVIAKDFASGEINLKLTAGDTAFAVGDSFLIPVSGTGKYKTVSAASTEGAGNAEQVLMIDTDASKVDVASRGWESGEFDAAHLIVAEGETAAAYREEMRLKGMIQIETVGGNY